MVTFRANQLIAAANSFFRLMKLRHHVTFIGVVLGAVLFSKAVTKSLIESLLLLYCSFNVLLYGGLYTLNDVVDTDSDAKHSRKKNRPLPSRKISRQTAVGFGVVLISAGLCTGALWFDQRMVGMYIGFLLVNMFYTFVAKNIPYVELAINAVTHPMRFFMGGLLVGGGIPRMFVTAVFFFAFGIAVVRRTVQKDVEGWEARTTLRYYSERQLMFLKTLSLGAILWLSVLDRTVPRVFYFVMIPVYALFVFGMYFSGPLRHFYRYMWTR